MLHKWWFYMIFTVFCCTFMNHCNPDSSTKTHISSHTKHVFFNNSFLQKIHISSHPEHVFFHKGSHILSPKHAIFQRLFQRKFTYPLTQNMSSFTKVHISSLQNMPFFKGSSTEKSQIVRHNPLLSKTLPQNFTHHLTQSMSF